MPPEIPQELWKETEQPLLDVLKRQAKDFLDERLSKVPREVLGGVEIGLGAPWEVIGQMAKSLGAELIVVGSHGYGGWDRLLGTTAAKVVNHAPCSVLVVHASKPS